jgi:hypothetical protein
MADVDPIRDLPNEEAPDDTYVVVLVAKGGAQLPPRE